MDTRRGFTDHEHLDEAELIHMNGRVYDYNVGRFMSVDPFIQSPTNTQSINPYSYIMNNPMSGIDPSGYASCEVTSQSCGTGSRIKQAKNEQAETAAKNKVTGDKTTQKAFESIHGKKSEDNGAQKSSQEGMNQMANDKLMDKMSQSNTNATTTNTQKDSDSGIGNKSTLSAITGSIDNAAESISNSVNRQVDIFLDENEMLLNFIADEGVNVLLRTGQAVGGVGQVILGGGICLGSLGLACVPGAAIMAKGGDNFYSGMTGKPSVSETFLQDVTGSKTAGTLINAGLDLSLIHI